MNNFKQTEELLYSYKYLIAEVKNLEIEIAELEYTGCKGVSYEQKIASNNFNSVVENEVLNRHKVKDELADKLFARTNIVKKINNAMESLDERSQNIIKLKYMDRIGNRNISYRLHITEEWLSRLNNKAVTQISKLI